jgi:hypothetical protein
MSYLAGRGVSQGPTQGQVALGPDLVAVRIPAPVLASRAPAVAARVHHRQELTSPAPLTGTVPHYGELDSVHIWCPESVRCLVGTVLEAYMIYLLSLSRNFP